MVTDLQFYQAVRAYSYRTKLLSGLNELEQKIVDYLSDRKLTRKTLPGYSVEVKEDGIVVKERPIEDLNQLYLKFDTAYGGDLDAGR